MPEMKAILADGTVIGGIEAVNSSEHGVLLYSEANRREKNEQMGYIPQDSLSAIVPEDADVPDS